MKIIIPGLFLALCAGATTAVAANVVPGSAPPAGRSAMLQSSLEQLRQERRQSLPAQLRTDWRRQVADATRERTDRLVSGGPSTASARAQP